MATILHTYTVQFNGWHCCLYLCSCSNCPLILVLCLPKKGAELPKWLLWGAAACGPVMMLGIEFGWIFSCSGRQPWTIYGMQRTVDASTRADFVGPLFILFIILYIGLGILTVFVLRTFFKKHPLTNDLHHEGGDSRA